MDISVVIPLLDEQDSLVELHDWIAQVMQSNRLTYELIFIDDGSRDDSWSIIKKLNTKNPSVSGIPSPITLANHKRFMRGLKK